jgi:hypothetical protein
MAVLYNTTKLIELSIWIHILVQRVHIIRVIKVIKSYTSCRSCALCYDENYDIKILKYQKVYKKLYLKMLVDNVISKVINMLKDII